MSYENAPATRLLATHCAICGRPLVDAVSVECGVGPICREESGFNAEASADARSTANAIVHHIATGISNAELIDAVATLRAFGFEKLADTIVRRKAVIVVEDWGDGTLAIFTPYHSDFVNQLKNATPWRKFDREQKCWLVPGGERVTKALWAAMKWAFPGALGVGPKGLFFTPAET